MSNDIRNISRGNAFPGAMHFLGHEDLVSEHEHRSFYKHDLCAQRERESV